MRVGLKPGGPNRPLCPRERERTAPAPSPKQGKERERREGGPQVRVRAGRAVALLSSHLVRRERERDKSSRSVSERSRGSPFSPAEWDRARKVLQASAKGRRRSLLHVEHERRGKRTDTVDSVDVCLECGLEFCRHTHRAGRDAADSLIQKHAARGMPEDRQDLGTRLRQLWFFHEVMS